MTTILKKSKNINFNKINQSLEQNKVNRSVNTKIFCGTIKLKQDALLIQKKIRNEWK
ncbi:MAG: hypothetical protein H6604_02925 [Flavobacteriales bacterium]|nr:hypothetical protein [Flavobacteriales bacterium]